MKKLIIILLITGGLVAGLYWKYQNSITTPVDPNDDTNISFQIKQGLSATNIAENLKEKDLINSKTTFFIYTKVNGLQDKILAGRFQLNKTMNTEEILQTLTDPNQAQFVLTIQEGLRVKDIDKKLTELGLSNEGDFIEEAKNFSGWEYYEFLDPAIQGNLDIPVEGYLYPDTYFLDPADFQTHDLIYIALDNFEQKTTDIFDKNQIADFHEKIIMASIIENEVFGKEDRELVSGILWKRLENSWTLGADATLLYITEDRKISSEDLEIDSAYNTRKNLGLPPGPISNPSLESIMAALNPKDSGYWFYLTTLDTGEVIYSSSNEEHNANKAKHLQ